MLSQSKFLISLYNYIQLFLTVWTLTALNIETAFSYFGKSRSLICNSGCKLAMSRVDCHDVTQSALNYVNQILPNIASQCQVISARYCHYLISTPPSLIRFKLSSYHFKSFPSRNLVMEDKLKQDITIMDKHVVT